MITKNKTLEMNTFDKRDICSMSLLIYSIIVERCLDFHGHLYYTASYDKVIFILNYI